MKKKLRSSKSITQKKNLGKYDGSIIGISWQITSQWRKEETEVTIRVGKWVAYLSVKRKRFIDKRVEFFVRRIEVEKRNWIGGVERTGSFEVVSKKDSLV